MIWGYTAAIAFAVLCAWCLVRVLREAGQERTTTTAALVWGVYLAHLGTIILLAVYPVWPLPIAWWLRAAIGGVLLASGVMICGLGMRAFGSVERMSGQDTDQLITTGIYAWSRNPQNVGWIIAQFGIALLGASGLGLILSGLFGVLFLIYVRFEERHLLLAFGDEYRRYLKQSHRLFGPPHTRKEAEQGAHTNSDSPEGGTARDAGIRAPQDRTGRVSNPAGRSEAPGRARSKTPR